MTEAALGARHPEIRRLRVLLRDAQERRSARRIVLEGPRLVADALRRGVVLEVVYRDADATGSSAEVGRRAAEQGVTTRECQAGVLARVGTTRTPQPVVAVATAPAITPLPSLASWPIGDGPVLVAADIAEPGNLGALVRSAEAAGAAAVVCCGETVDVANPKVVRASAGAVFGIPLVEAVDAVEVLEALATSGRPSWGAVADGGDDYCSVDLGGPGILVVGNEARGLTAAVTARLDRRLTVGMAGNGESLNVAVAASVVLFEAARQRNTR